MIDRYLYMNESVLGEKGMKKKSYMSRKNLLSEGFYSRISALLGAGLFAKAISKLRKHKKFKPEITKINKLVSDLEKGFEEEFGKKVKFDKFKISDFTKK